MPYIRIILVNPKILLILIQLEYLETLILKMYKLIKKLMKLGKIKFNINYGQYESPPR